MRTQHGFTLIELMITVAIIAILSAIAIPQYSEYVMRSRITEATMTLSDQRLKMERYFQDNRSFSPGGGIPAACSANTVAPPPGPTAHFTFTCVVLSANTYLVTATGFGPMLGFVYTVNDANVRVTTGVPAGWTLAPACWALKKDGSC
jgi:type IV pilus assembly protein PilE